MVKRTKHSDRYIHMIDNDMFFSWIFILIKEYYREIYARKKRVVEAKKVERRTLKIFYP